MKIERTDMFCAAHRIPGQGGKCEHLHGHNYQVTIEIECNTLNNLDMIIDYNILKDIVKRFDHITIVDSKDITLETFCLNNEQPYFLLDLGKSTAENIAKCIGLDVQDELHNIIVDKQITVTVSETPKTKATWRNFK